MNEEESPFSHVPVSSRTESPSSYTYEGQLERVGQLATGLRSETAGKRVAIRLVVLIPLVVLVLLAISTVVSIVWNVFAG